MQVLTAAMSSGSENPPNTGSGSEIAIEVAIKASKTDPFRKGVKAFFGAHRQSPLSGGSGSGVYGSERKHLRSVFHVEEWTPPVKRDTDEEVEGRIGLYWGGCVLYSGHSFRIDAATTTLS